MAAGKHSDLVGIVEEFVKNEWPAARVVHKGYSSYMVCKNGLARALRTRNLDKTVKIVTKGGGDIFLVNLTKAEVQ